MSSVPPSRWRPSPFLRSSAWLHAGALGLVLVRPELWPWSVSAAVGNQLLLAGAGLWPRSAWLGPNWTHLPAAAAARREVAITIDDGPDPVVTPRVLDLLDAHHAKATFFVIGARTEQHFDLAREIVQRGHALENHSYRHPGYFSVLGPRSIAVEVQTAQDIIGCASGQPPQFFRAPAGLRSPLLEPVLSRLGLRLASWTRRGFDTLNNSAESVLHRLTHGIAGGDILLLHDGNAALTPAGAPVILEVLPRLLDQLAARRLVPVTLRAAQNTGNATGNVAANTAAGSTTA